MEITINIFEDKSTVVIYKDDIQGYIDALINAAVGKLYAKDIKYLADIKEVLDDIQSNLPKRGKNEHHL